MLPAIKITRYSMRPRSHNIELPMFDYLSISSIRLLWADFR